MNLLKQDTRSEEGRNVPVKNIDAAQELTNIIRTNLGPNGLCKLVVTHLDKVIVTRRTETVLFNLTVEHPIGKLIVMAAKNQAQEVGDGTTQIVAFIGELLNKIKPLVLMRLPMKDVQEGLDLAMTKALEVLPNLEVGKVSDLRDQKEVLKALLPVIGAKIAGQEQLVAQLVAKACIDVLPTSSQGEPITRFNVDNIRFAKIMGGSLSDSTVVRGFCLARNTEGKIKHIKNAKIAVYGCAIEKEEGETKGTIVLNSAQELQNYTALEENRMRDKINNVILATGAKVVVCGATISEIAMHYLEQAGVMVIKVPSKFDLQRFCAATNAVAKVTMDVSPQPEELGFANSIDAKEVGGTTLLVISQEKEQGGSDEESVDSRISTIVIRSATQAQLDDIERVAIDSVNTFKALTRDSRLVAGGGGFEMELSKLVGSYGKTVRGLGQYAIGAFADALICVPRILSETAGLDSNEIVTQLAHAHAQGKSHEGVDLNTLEIGDMKATGIFDLLILKEWVLRFALETVKTILSVDQIIMAKPAGLKPPPQQTSGAADSD
ncbi:MAG: putative T-complex protein 1 subunit theta [Streblomastix strix]|uniref:CCT-theta n=1 Tax=Streblomastix strix TaxID=222440 RepID=A0A5J4WCM7_9EUKA|nr:MAG: putative T-complex protein 1 subunit theta [Streblomastix strix]